MQDNPLHACWPPGSGCPHVNRDAIFWGRRWTAQDQTINAVSTGVPAFHETIALLLRRGVSLVADATLCRGEPEPDLAELCALAEAVNVHCRALYAVERFRRREIGSATGLGPIDVLVAWVEADLPRTSDPLARDWPVIEVNTTRGYSPPLEEIASLLCPSA